jgi:prevent-host-death family protein
MDTNKGVSIEDFRTNLADYINRVRYGKDRIVVNKYNKKAAILISSEEYDWLTDPTSRFTRKEWQEKFQVFEDTKADTQGISLAEIEQDIADALKIVRQKRRRRAKK